MVRKTGRSFENAGARTVMAMVLVVALMLGMLSGCGENGGITDNGMPENSLAQGNGESSAGEMNSKEGTTEDTITKILERMTLEEKIGQMMIPAFRIWQDLREDGTDVGKSVENAEQKAGAEKVNITELNDEIRECIKRNHFGGTLLFAENIDNAEQTLRLVMEIQSVNLQGGGIPMLVAADQEGGNVTRLGFGTTGVGNMALAATGNAKNAEEMAWIYGTELQALGLNVDFAPVLDINNNAKNPVIGVRSFSDSPEIVRDFGVAYMEGLMRTGTIATLKHFPGHGDTNTDSHTGFPCIQKTYEELKSFELIPFEAAIKKGADMIMTAHIQYPEIEKETYVSITTGEEVYLPATMSRTILTDILRKDMGFEGVVVTDALDMDAITKNFAFEDVLCKTINAGADMLVLPAIRNTDDFEQTDGVVKLTAGFVREGKIAETRIDEAVRRILTVKEKYGLLEQSDFTMSDEKIRKALATVGGEESRKLAMEIAGQALTLLKNENQAFPLKRSEGDETLILFADSCASRVGYGELVKQMIGDEKITVMKHTQDNQDECLQAAKEAEHVILVYRDYSEACLNPSTGDGFSSAVFDEIIDERHKAGKQVILISCQLPYDAARFTEADAILLAYCSSVMRSIPNESGPGSAYAPNLAAAIIACFGEEKVNGRLPVNIPALDENYGITDQILFQRQ